MDDGLVGGESVEVNEVASRRALWIGVIEYSHGARLSLPFSDPVMNHCGADIPQKYNNHGIVSSTVKERCPVSVSLLLLNAQCLAERSRLPLNPRHTIR